MLYELPAFSVSFLKSSVNFLHLQKDDDGAGNSIVGIHDIHANFDDAEIPNGIRTKRDGAIKIYNARDDGSTTESWIYIMFQTQELGESS